MTTNVLAFIAEIAEQVWEDPPPVPEGLDVSSEQLLEDLTLLEWIMLGHPGHGAKLLKELYFRYSAAPAPKKGKSASIWYRMRNHMLHLWDNWRQLTCYRTLRCSEGLEVEATNNAAERAIGWTVEEALGSYIVPKILAEHLARPADSVVPLSANLCHVQQPKLAKASLSALVHGGGWQELERLLDFGGLGERGGRRGVGGWGKGQLIPTSKPPLDPSVKDQQAAPHLPRKRLCAAILSAYLLGVQEQVLGVTRAATR